MEKSEMLNLPTLSLLEEEAEILDLASKAWNKFIKVTPQYEREQIEFMERIHNVQDFIYARAARRAFNQNREMF